MYSYWLILHSNTTYFITEKKAISQRKEFPIAESPASASHWASWFLFYFCFLVVGSRVGFLFCQSHVSCSLLWGMALLPFVLGKLQNGQEYQWEVTEITYSFGLCDHLSCIKERFVNDGSVWKEASAADCKNLLVLQHLETHGLEATEDCVPMP